MRRSSPAAWIAAAVSTVSQNAWTETRGAGAMCSSRGAASAGAGSGVAVCSACSDHLPTSLIAPLVGVWIDGRRALALAIFVDADGALGCVGRRLAARLHEVGRIRRPWRRDCAGWRSRNSSTAGSRSTCGRSSARDRRATARRGRPGRDQRIAEPERRQLALARMVRPHADAASAARRPARGSTAISLQRVAGGALVGAAGRRSMMTPPVASCLQFCAKASTSARCVGDKPAAVGADEELAACVPAFRDRDRMAHAIVVRNAAGGVGEPSWCCSRRAPTAAAAISRPRAPTPLRGGGRR